MGNLIHWQGRGGSRGRRRMRMRVRRRGRVSSMSTRTGRNRVVCRRWYIVRLCRNRYVLCLWNIGGRTADTHCNGIRSRRRSPARWGRIGLAWSGTRIDSGFGRASPSSCTRRDSRDSILIVYIGVARWSTHGTADRHAIGAGRASSVCAATIFTSSFMNSLPIPFPLLPIEPLGTPACTYTFYGCSGVVIVLEK